ncbi:type 1 glutamine amidotransferase domain-containing protein [Mangrovivirga cuniculi]|uniref:Protease n=1 Tax=Mangrovivirga cuniculi TaxID=2715131 RepID=A0A4D7JQ82_9BACT|nr:type 1 glutamine amidotransferase domain-containing protein [Mangrovivirga cuniculi]QCK16817.1 protease [Mangrovivirga cuniculi]
MQTLNNKKVAVLLTDGFEEVEFTKPMEALMNSGADVEVIAPKGKKVKSWDHDHWSREYDVDKNLNEVNSDDYNCLMLPGGVMNPDSLRMNDEAVEFVGGFFEKGKPIAAICHAPQLMIETGALTGREMTSYPSLKSDIKNAGARWVDKEVVVDQGLTTSRNPDDIPAFIDKMIEEFAEGKHERQKTI